MTYYLDIFSPETYERFLASDRTIAGFDDKTRTANAAQRVRPGDKLLGYITGLKRWAAVLEVVSGPFRDNTPRFADKDDPYVIRFRVNATVVLPFERTLPIEEEHIWSRLSFTRRHEPGSTNWTGPIRNPLNQLDDADGAFLERVLSDQTAPRSPMYFVDPKELRRLTQRRKPRAVRLPPLSRPVREEPSRDPEPVRPAAPPAFEETDTLVEGEGRESIRIQARLAEIGLGMGFSVWIPPNDRGRVEQHLPDDGERLLSQLPLNYDETTNRTIEQIDVLWLRGRSIVRAFEVEHTTAVYSGLLRMADLLALQPNMDIRLHIVAPTERRTKVFQEIRRPVFERLENRPLADRCTFISYEKLRELQQNPDLAYLTDGVLERYEERA